MSSERHLNLSLRLDAEEMGERDPADADIDAPILVHPRGPISA